LPRLHRGAEVLQGERTEVRGDKRGRFHREGEGAAGEDGDRFGAADFLQREANRRAGGVELAAEQRGVRPESGGDARREGG